MALNKYQGTNNAGGSVSGWEARFAAHFQCSSSNQYRVEIIDTKLTSSGFNWNRENAVEFNLGADGFTLTHEGSSNDLHQSIVTSNVSIDFYTQNESHDRLFDQINASGDHRFGIMIYRYIGNSIDSTPENPNAKTVPIWVGLINPEGTTREISKSGKFLRLNAHCGLASLNNIPYLKDDGTKYTDTPRLTTIIQRCLKHIPTTSLWGYNSAASTNTVLNPTSTSQNFFIDQNHNFDQTRHVLFGVLKQYVSTLHFSRVASQTFYNETRNPDRFGGQVLNTETVSCAEVLNSICQVFRSKIYLNDDFSFVFGNPLSPDSNGSVFQASWNSLPDLLTDPTTFGNSTTNLRYAINEFTQSAGTKYREITKGADESFLHPIKLSNSIHIKGGTQSIFEPFGSQVFTSEMTTESNPSGATNIHTITKEDGTFSVFDKLENPDAVFNVGESPSLMGRLHTFLDPNHNQNGSSSSALLHIGGKVVVDVKIKIGNYYLKGNITNSAQQQAIKRTAASDLGFAAILRNGAVEWTTNESVYSIPCPNTLSDPECMIATHEGDPVEYAGGFHLSMNGNATDEFRYSSGFMGSGGTEHDTSKFDLSWTLPPLPVGTHTGVSVNFSVRAFNRLGVAITNTTDLSNLKKNSQSGLVQLYNFKMLTGVESSESDAVFRASQASNSESVNVCASVIGDRFNDSILGSLEVQQATNTFDGAWTYSGANWGSASNLTATSFIHQLNALEGLQERDTSIKIRRATIKIIDETQPIYSVTVLKPPTFRNILKFFDEPNTPTYTPVSRTWSASSNVIDYVLAFHTININLSSDESNNKGDRPIGRPPKPGLDFNSDVNGKNINGGATTGTIAKLNLARNHINANATGLNAITVNATGSSTPAVNLGEIHDVLSGAVSTSSVYDNTISAFDVTGGIADANRGGQGSGSRNVVTVDNNGVLKETAPPTSTMYLTSTSGGSVRWAGVETVLTTLSGRASLYYANRYYYASGFYGFNFYNWSSSAIAFSSINDQHANAGVILPKDGTRIKIKTNVRNDSGTNNIDICLHLGNRPAGSGSNISLQHVGTITAACSGGQDLYHTADGSFLHSFTAGTLLFMSFKRGGLNQTQYVNFSATISII